MSFSLTLRQSVRAAASSVGFLLVGSITLICTALIFHEVLALLSGSRGSESLGVSVLGMAGMLGLVTSLVMLIAFPVILPTFAAAVLVLNAPRLVAVALGQLCALGTYFWLGAYAPGDPLHIPIWSPVACGLVASTTFLWRYQLTRKTGNVVSPTSSEAT
ncbi:hypothetical protein [uncultured Aliiroseovarius sp.]|uniref:hypothetical protein n=1 Tax=uncultured Aliiroseovarius sp. TaxID=1658783 RepID=UPI002601C349|nr:hypothetical protein [uncultured Aliiroseovarius sp.]